MAGVTGITLNMTALQIAQRILEITDPTATAAPTTTARPTTTATPTTTARPTTTATPTTTARPTTTATPTTTARPTTTAARPTTTTARPTTTVMPTTTFKSVCPPLELEKIPLGFSKSPHDKWPGPLNDNSRNCYNLREHTTSPSTNVMTNQPINLRPNGGHLIKTVGQYMTETFHPQYGTRFMSYTHTLPEPGPTPTSGGMNGWTVLIKELPDAEGYICKVNSVGRCVLDSSGRTTSTMRIFRATVSYHARTNIDDGQTYGRKDMPKNIYDEIRITPPFPLKINIAKMQWEGSMKVTETEWNPRLLLLPPAPSGGRRGRGSRRRRARKGSRCG